MDATEAFARLGLPLTASEADILERYRKLAHSAHPDHGGTNAEMIALITARDCATRYARSKPAIDSPPPPRAYRRFLFLYPAALLLAALGVAAIITRQQAPRIQGTTITVNTIMDDGPGICAVSCTLRDAIATANPGDTIAFGELGVIALTDGPLRITKSLQLRGPGAGILAIDGQGIYRVLQVESGVTVEVSDVTIQNGTVVGDNGGGINNLGTLALTNVTVTGNAAIPNLTNEGGWGGGILNRHKLTLTNSVISDNRAAIGAGFINSAGSFPPSTATTTQLINVTITGNMASTTLTNASAGGIWNDGTLIYSGGAVTENISWFASALFNAGTTTLTNVNFIGNRAGGAIRRSNSGTLVYNDGANGDTSSLFAGSLFNIGTATLTNVEFLENRADVGYIGMSTPHSMGARSGLPPPGNGGTSSPYASGALNWGPVGGYGSSTPPSFFATPSADHIPANIAVESGHSGSAVGSYGSPLPASPFAAPSADQLPAGIAVGSDNPAAPAIAMPAPGPSCWPDQRERVAASLTDDGRLQVDVTVTGAGNHLVSLRFLAGQLAAGDTLIHYALPEQTAETDALPPFTLTLPPGTTTYTFFLQRAAPDRGTTASFLIVDSCGEWPAFVGGGYDAL